MEGVLIVREVKIVKGFLLDTRKWCDPAGMIVYEKIARALYIKGFINEKEVSFYSPTVIFKVSKGFINNIRVIKGPKKWFTVDETDYNKLNWNVIKSNIQAGDTLNIRYSKKNEKNINRVKILN
ncbi:MAG: hypothetical protein PF487_09090 [Bacteroidales bacterium]|jgi:hypothetical protein|nr:hypothetical protein [Bacteroidales bacterium]